jgi:predicted metal-dependent enzyme (double-stranded beta helix superfamily)
MDRLEDLINELREALKGSDLSTVVEVVWRTVAEEPLVSDTKLLLLHTEPGLTIVHTAFPGGFSSPPHDHHTWAVIGIYQGQEDNTFYRLVDGTRSIEETDGRSLRTREVMTLEPDTIHMISNPLREPLIALHVYGDNIFKINRSAWDLATMVERPWMVEPEPHGK